MRLKVVLLASAVLIPAVTLSGCGGGMAALLKIAGVEALLPDRWTSSGGVIRIFAKVISGEIIDRVVARITDDDDNTVTEVILTPNSQGEYEGSFQAEANTDGTSTETYTAVVTAVAASGNTAESEPITVEVPPVESPQ